MTKEVKLRICGMHMHGEDGDRDDVEVISVGRVRKWTCLRCEKSGEIQGWPVRDYQAWPGRKPHGVCAK